MTKADLVEKVTAQIARTAGPLISKKDRARVVDSFLDLAGCKAPLVRANISIKAVTMDWFADLARSRSASARLAWRVIRAPVTRSEVAARPVPVFKPVRSLRAMVAEASERVTP